MKRTLCLITLSAMFLAGGCYSQTYIYKTATPSTAKTERKMNFYFWGLSGTGVINVPEVCGARPVSRINTQQTFVNMLLTAITLGIYSPRTAIITCGQ